MGMVIDGRWSDTDSVMVNGRFVRPQSVYAGVIGQDVVAAIAAEPGRFHLLASLSCPWSHRTLVLRAVKGLAAAVPVHIVGGPRVEGYAVNGGALWTVPGSKTRIRHLHQLYTLSDASYTGLSTVPVLWDSRRLCIVSNESARIVRAFDAAGSGPGLYPAPLQAAIDALNDRLQRHLSNAVYRAGFAETQQAYDEAVGEVFDTLDWLEARLADRRYLFGDEITETDWRLFPTLVRFDAVYHGHFKCSRRRLVDYPRLWAYARDLYARPGVAQTVDVEAIRVGYYLNDRGINPHGIVAVAPAVDWGRA